MNSRRPPRPGRGPIAPVDQRARTALAEMRVGQGQHCKAGDLAERALRNYQESGVSAREAQALAILGQVLRQQIADATPGMVLVSAGPEEQSPMSSNGDLSLPSGAHHFYMQCSCDELSATWRHINDLENDSMDVVGIRATESVQNLGGSIVHCDTGPSPDQCHSDGSVDFEDPQGVAHDFQSEEGERAGPLRSRGISG